MLILGAPSTSTANGFVNGKLPSSTPGYDRSFGSTQDDQGHPLGLLVKWLSELTAGLRVVPVDRACLDPGLHSVVGRETEATVPRLTLTDCDVSRMSQELLGPEIA